MPWLAACERRLAESVAGHVPGVSVPAQETLAAGGKRVRPLLLFCAAPRSREAGDDLVCAATAVELVHMATLVHDDLIDGAALRRGRPTVAQERGSEVAIRVGDFLFARAFAELTRAGRPAAVQALAAAALDLSQGEMDQQRAAHDLQLAEEAYLARVRRKTASLFSVACRLGALVGGAGVETQERVAAYGEAVGVAFQIFDDILDIGGAPAATGKARGTDLRGGTVTLPVIRALRIEPGLARDVHAAGCGAAGPDEVEALCARLATHPGMVSARETALGFVASARVALDGPLDGIDPEPLLEIADGVVDRYG
ncbi:MAG: polyprenyl synthetase family protein [Actinomycetota bacterium]